MAVYLTDEDFKKLKKVLKKDKELYSEVSEIMPSLKEGFEEGKYYAYKDEVFFKAVRITEDGEIWGYGLVDNTIYEENAYFADLCDYEHPEEITKEEFLEQIAKHAVDVLGFRQGVVYTSTIGTTNIAMHKPKQFSPLEGLHCGFGQGLIFKDGEFGEIIEPPKEAVATVWEPTMELRWKNKRITSTLSPTQDKNIKNLQQKWVETDTGAEEWRKIETV